MNTRKLLVTIATASAFFATSAFAAEIYKYTDEDGNVHYGDRPSGEPTEETVYVASKRTDNATVQRQFDERYAPKPEAEPAQQAAAAPEAEAEEKLTRAEKIAARQEREQNCQKNRDRMATLLNSRRLYRENEDGEREYLDDAARQEARDKVQELIEQYCD